MKTSKLVLALFLSVGSITASFGQGVGINGTGASPDPSAGLDVSFNDKGFLPPRMTTAERNAIGTPAAGLQIFNTDTECINMYTGTTWKQSCFDCDFAAPVVSNNGPLCEGATLNLTASTVSGAIYNWTGPNGFSSSLQNPSVSNATVAASGIYTLIVTLNGCATAPIITNVTINAVPAAPTAANGGPACIGDNVNLTASSIVGASYSWTGPSGFTASTQNPVISNVTVGNAGSYSVVATVNGCSSSGASTTLVINQIPATPGSISGSATECVNASGVAYSISAVAGATSYTWTVPSGATVASGQSTISATVDFGTTSGNVCVTADNVCGSSSTSCLAVTLSGSSGSQTFNYSGSIVNWTVPTCTYSINIEAWGAQGGNATGGQSGGKGARIKGDVSVTPGQQLKILVGQQGTASVTTGEQGGGTGGGGTFVALSDNTPLIVAGGGGGAINGSATANGGDAVTGNDGMDGGGTASGDGGTGGNGGTRYSWSGWHGGTGGGGFYGDGVGNSDGNTSFGSAMTPGKSFVNGGAGGSGGSAGRTGGFGGGGAAGFTGGGGGGYSGGGGGSHQSPVTYCGGGGGSYNIGTNQTNVAGVKTGNGQVIITW